LNEAGDPEAPGPFLLRFRILFHLADVDLGDRIPVQLHCIFEETGLFGRSLGRRASMQSRQQVGGEGVVFEGAVVCELKPLGTAGSLKGQTFLKVPVLLLSATNHS
jgi:hypothetical protein